MNVPLVNILTRISRPRLFKRCLESIQQQTYSNIKHFTYPDSPERIKEPYDWNLFCNELKSQVQQGYFFFLDDDDFLTHPYIVEELVRHLQDEPDGLIVQFLRNGKPKPNNSLIAQHVIRKGLIGGGCLVLNTKHKSLADWDAREAADFYWIEKISKQIILKFVPLILQVAGNNGLHGRSAPITKMNFGGTIG